MSGSTLELIITLALTVTSGGLGFLLRAQGISKMRSAFTAAVSITLVATSLDATIRGHVSKFLPMAAVLMMIIGLPEAFTGALICEHLGCRRKGP